MNYFLTKFAVEYNCGAYGASTYNNSDPCTTTGTGTQGAGGSLAYTGIDFLLPLVLGIALIAASIIFIIKSKRNKKSTSTL